MPRARAKPAPKPKAKTAATRTKKPVPKPAPKPAPKSLRAAPAPVLLPPVATAPDPDLNDKQALFVREYLVDLSPADAYMRAYGIDNRESAQTSANRLLQNVAVLAAIDALQRERLERLDLSADWVVLGFRMAYLRAVRDADHPSALRALENIGKFLGIYERDNAQKRQHLSFEDVDRLKAELEMRGWDFSRANFPAHLVHVLPANSVAPPEPPVVPHEPADLRGPVHGPTGADRADLRGEGRPVADAP